MRSVMLVWLPALFASGCSGTVGPASIAGKWAQDITIPGSIVEMNLTSTGSTISGSGDWCAEAGPCGTLTVAGTINGIDVHLDLSFTPTRPPGLFPSFDDHFDGRLTSPGSLRGSLTTVVTGQPPGSAQQVGYHRA